MFTLLVVLKTKVLPSCLRSNEMRGGVIGGVCFFLFVYHGSNSGRYKILSLYFFSIKGLGTSSLF